MAVALFDVYKQLTFYGAYHSNKINVAIHIICVPWILWSWFALIANFSLPEYIPKYSYHFNEYLQFDLNPAAIYGAVYLAYYYLLEPVAALLYTPQMVLSLLTATAFAKRPDYLPIAAAVHAVCWVAQFIGHGVAEKRAPALLDNLVGAAVLAPFFVHLEVLFMLGYRPDMHKRLTNDIGKEIARVRKIEGDKKRAAGKKEL